jgi:hypothetical protein
VSYQQAFQALAAQHPEARLVWIDIEDHADALEDGDEDIPDIENFPTLLLLRDGNRCSTARCCPTPRWPSACCSRPHAAAAERCAGAGPGPGGGRPGRGRDAERGLNPPAPGRGPACVRA